ncbi:MAG: SAM-dependent methyltransferase [Planctomycetaceae bacterium]|nr:MAG: SAM-dependent methyltransferase [Planctomycetaceae bacterium]
MNSAEFLFVVCQRGAESALKNELAVSWPEFRLAFSRPGFVTFKLPPDHGLSPDFDLRSVFARSYGFSLGRLVGAHAETMAEQLWELAGHRAWDHLHVWQRDPAVPGDRDFEPGISTLAQQVGLIVAASRPPSVAPQRVFPVNLVARPGQQVLDCVLVEPGQWWIGGHQASTMPSRWPGGTPKIDMPDEAVSRAYLKITEALLWSRLPVAAGDHCVELGSSPGGACQALLDRGLIVTGIDPADMSPVVLQHPNFTHIKARGADLKRREFRRVKWLVADANVAPNHTLDTVEHIVTHRQVDIQGILLTLKLIDWHLADQIPEYLQRIRSWGYPLVRARQLAFNRQEFTVVALRRRPRPSNVRFATRRRSR